MNKQDFINVMDKNLTQIIYSLSSEYNESDSDSIEDYLETILEKTSMLNDFIEEFKDSIDIDNPNSLNEWSKRLSNFCF